MEARLANPRGFCAGVDRAIEIVERALEIYGAPVYVLHEIVHNRHVLEDLSSRGVIFVREWSAKQCHDTVPCELVDCAPIFMNFIHQNPEAPVHDSMDLFGIELLRHGRIIGHVSKEDRNQFSFPFHGTTIREDLIG